MRLRFLQRLVWTSLLSLVIVQTGFADEVLAPVSQRFATASTQDSPDLQRHVLPLMSRLGCNGRACHGSFQGRGGFRLSLFGYDFAADHQALAKGDQPRVNVGQPNDSLILQKPTLLVDHEGGQRFKVDSWQFQLLRRWIADGAKGVSDQASRLTRLEVQPPEITFTVPKARRQLRVVAHWSDGSQEDVTPLCRYRSNDDGIAIIDEEGIVSMVARGDTEIVVFYDNGVRPVPVMLPVSDLTGKKYPQQTAPTPIDKLVINKLRKLGITPSELCTDSEYLRRVSLDLTGTLPTAEEVASFSADKSANKRAAKIEEMFARSSYVAWWTTKLCEITGNVANQLPDKQFVGDEARQWYEWIYRRVQQNMPYDELVAGIVLANGREHGESYQQYCESMTAYFKSDQPQDFAKRDTMPYFWARRPSQPKEMAERFAHSFLGVRLGCAECHKHPFDQWSKQDFDEFKKFFSRVSYGVQPQDSEVHAQISKEAGESQLADPKLMVALVRDGKTVPWNEIFVGAPRVGRRGAKNPMENRKNSPIKSVALESTAKPTGVTTRLLGGEEVFLADNGDPRSTLMDWMRREDNPYFARALVNRVWSNYFGRGIIDPPDDQSLANPPSNPELLDYLVRRFIEHKYDLRWLHREIISSRTYQLSWRTNPTNEADLRNFSHAMPRRLSAEVAYDAVTLATASNDGIEQFVKDSRSRAIGTAFLYDRGRGPQAYMFTVFGKPSMNDACGCLRSNEPSVLQALYLHNDPDLLAQIDRKGGWISELGGAVQPAAASSADGKKIDSRGLSPAEIQSRIKALENRLAGLVRSGDSQNIKKTQAQLTSLRNDLNAKVAQKQKPRKPSSPAAQPNAIQLVQTAYLRTLSRPPSDEEVARALRYFEDARPVSLGRGMRDLVWALLNTKEFILNH